MIESTCPSESFLNPNQSSEIVVSESLFLGFRVWECKVLHSGTRVFAFRNAKRQYDNQSYETPPPSLAHACADTLQEMTYFKKKKAERKKKSEPVGHCGFFRTFVASLSFYLKKEEMRSFASDNNSGVHPRILQAVMEANKDHAVGYGDDPWTAQATERLKEFFGEEAEPFFVFNGTGANSVALQVVTQPYNSILCAQTAHINVDECGAPGRMTGCAIVPIATPDGKLTPDLIRLRLVNFGVCHHSQPKAVYISQVSELGTVYTIDEVRAIADLLHNYNMYLHMDGARLANACEYLGCSMRAVTVDAGVDILSFGGTKNGMMMGEAVISFRPELNERLSYIRKQSAQLASKARYLAAQYLPYLTDDLWLLNAQRANAYARRLAETLARHPQIHFTQKVESNQLFFTLPTEALRKLQEKYFFYMWNEETNEARFVTSWDTTSEDIESLEQTLEEIFNEK